MESRYVPFPFWWSIDADEVGFMKQLPNLLKQESSSAATLINVLLRMYRDPRDAHRATRSGVLERLVPYVPSIVFMVAVS